MAAGIGVDGWRFAVTVCLCHVAHLYFVCNIFSFAGLMCVDLGWAENRDKAGYVAGYLQSANTLGRIPTAGLWGLLADRYGYRCTVLWTLVFLSLGGVSFGLSTQFALSVSSRFFFFGLCNGWMTLFVPLCSVAGEKQFQMFGHALGAGQLLQMLGPAIGGWTYMADSKWPAARPSFIGICLTFAAFGAAWFWLPSGSSPRTTHGNEPPSERRFGWCSGVVIATQVLRATSGYLQFTLFDVVPIWAISHRSEGGLELSEGGLGLVLVVSGVVNAFFAVLLMPRMTKRFGAKNAMAWGCLVAAIAYALIPWLASPVQLCVVHSIGTAALTVFCAVASIFTTNTVHPSQRGAANGVASTLDAMAKGLAPLVGATTFAWSLEHLGRNGRGLIFIIMAIVQVACLVMTLLLPSSVEQDLATLPSAPLQQPGEL